MSMMVFGYGSTFLGLGEHEDPETKLKAFYIVFKDTGQENRPGPIDETNRPAFLSDEDNVSIDPQDVVFFFNTREQRDRVYDSFNT
jgi:hypothetical protein